MAAIIKGKEKVKSLHTQLGENKSQLKECKGKGNCKLCKMCKQS